MSRGGFGRTRGRDPIALGYPDGAEVVGPWTAARYGAVMDSTTLLDLRSDDRAALLLVGLRGDW